MNHLGIGVAIGLQQTSQGAGPAPSDWILKTGAWDDGGVWSDTDVWKDS